MDQESAKEAAVSVFVDLGECRRQRFGFGTGFVAMPLHVGPLPIDRPNVPRTDIANLGDRLFDPLVGTSKNGAIQKQFNGLTFDSLAFAHSVAKFERRPVVRPEFLFQLAEDLFGFFLCKGHEASKP